MSFSAARAHADTPEHAWPPPQPSRRRVATFPSVLATNPYQRLLYAELARHGFELSPDARFTLRWLWNARRDVAFLHFHWVAGFYRFGHGPKRLRGLLSWLELPVFSGRLAAARLLGYRLVWTIHQVRPHESVNHVLDRIARRVLARMSHVLIAHDRATAHAACRELDRSFERAYVIPHGAYVGVYPPGRSRAEVRGALGLGPDTFTFLCFGDLRAYKDVDRLLGAFRSASLPNAAVVVAGGVRSEADGAAVRASAAVDSRIKALLERVPDESVSELFAASDAAVVARSDGGTSGALILALSMGMPTVAARRPVYTELLGDEEAGWLFEPGDTASLADALERAASASPETLRCKAGAAQAQADRLRWPEIGARTAAALRAALAGVPAKEVQA
jgi:beta-1,4-mannosyltransferase